MSMSNVISPASGIAAAVDIAGRGSVRAEASAIPTLKPAAATSIPNPVPAVQDGGKAALERASRQIESFVRSSGRDLQFRVDDESGRVIVSVRDSATGELIRQIPNEETLRIAQALEQRDSKALNLLIDDKA
jgi:flagellar protein FlaG